ncbi:sulfatase-like hydrolase/transferase [Colwellia echini]|uniref:Sulfatase-like hydrolase/transferase n=1 Tax=Colwellia echini TaxID=1982103 RepID=A0ABY3MYF8_9GAMM|nr:sulfatase-like hydrolase/transferase [Colwellia echini]TYK66261.1 sulfatase-like hydrolase/transferase [Colwellia echini]
MTKTLFKSLAYSLSTLLVMGSLNGCSDIDKTKSVSTENVEKNISNESLTSNKTKQPNVLILFFDDMRFDTFSYRGGPVNTPNIDALAAESTRFDNAMTTTGLCSPSRAAMFTGRWGHKNGLDDNVELFHSRKYQLDTSEGGLIKRAVDTGYYVGYVGKWHIGPQGPKIRGAQFVREHADTRVRKDRHYVPYDDVASIKRYEKGILDEGDEKHVYYQTLPGKNTDTHAYDKVRFGKEMLRAAANQDKPFFGVVSFNQPHPPYRVPEPYASMFDPNDIEMPSNYTQDRTMKPMAQDRILWPWHEVGHMTDLDWRRSRSFYYGAIAMVDDIVGELLDTAKEVGLYDDLYIVLVGDQGSMIGEHNLFDKGPYAYDEVMRIPLLIRNPTQQPRIVNKQVSLIDIAPTLAELMALPNDGDVDGRSLNQLIAKGDIADQGREDTALYAYEWYNGSWFGLRAIRTATSKFVWYPGDNRDELYDLTKDAGEMNNLIFDTNYHDELIRLTGLLEKELIRTEDPSLEVFQHHMKTILKQNKPEWH